MNKIKKFLRRKKDEKLKPVTIASSLFFYGWNRWSKQECDLVFGYLSDHIWAKWMSHYNNLNGPSGAFERLYRDLDDGNRQKLVERALVCYKGSEELI